MYLSYVPGQLITFQKMYTLLESISASVNTLAISSYIQQELFSKLTPNSLENVISLRATWSPPYDICVWPCVQIPGTSQTPQNTGAFRSPWGLCKSLPICRKNWNMHICVCKKPLHASYTYSYICRKNSSMWSVLIWPRMLTVTCSQLNKIEV